MKPPFIVNLLIAIVVVITSIFIVLFHHHTLEMLGLLALSYGLRHGFDADHILAIDNAVRQFQANNQRSDTTGIFFALGHSTIVFSLTVFIVLGITHIHAHFTQLQKIGDVAGSILSALFLWLSATLNFSSLLSSNHAHSHASFIGKYLSRFFYLIDKPYKIYWVGFLFGLGFDTATEVGLLSIAATSALEGFQIGLVLLLPILFATGMVLTDSFDSLLMSSLYRSTAKQNEKLRFYYKIIIVVTGMLSFVVGLSELISISNSEMHNGILYALNGINHHFEMIGGTIAIIFFISFLYIQYRYYFLSKGNV